MIELTNQHLVFVQCHAKIVVRIESIESFLFFNSIPLRSFRTVRKPKLMKNILRFRSQPPKTQALLPGGHETFRWD